MRDLTGPTQGRAIRDLLQTMLVSEALKPSKRLWFLSGWVSDIGVIDNRARGFGWLDPDWPLAMVGLSRVLSTIVHRGGRLALILREDPLNRSFVARLASTRRAFPDRIRVVFAPEFHEKGIVSDRFSLDGSMNFTYRGIEVNDEHVVFRTAPSDVATRRLTLEGRWGGQFDAES